VTSTLARVGCQWSGLLLTSHLVGVHWLVWRWTHSGVARYLGGLIGIRVKFQVGHVTSSGGRGVVVARDSNAEKPLVSEMQQWGEMIPVGKSSRIPNTERSRCRKDLGSKKTTRCST